MKSWQLGQSSFALDVSIMQSLCLNFVLRNLVQQTIVSNIEQLRRNFQTRNTLFHGIHCNGKCKKMQGRRHNHTFQLVDKCNTMAVATVYEN